MSFHVTLFLGETMGTFEGPFTGPGDVIKIPNDPSPTPLTGKFVVIQLLSGTPGNWPAIGFTELRKTCQVDKEGGVFKTCRIELAPYL